VVAEALTGGLSSDNKGLQQQLTSPLTNMKLECGPMPNVMATLPNTGGTLCSTPQSLADTHN